MSLQPEKYRKDEKRRRKKSEIQMKTSWRVPAWASWAPPTGFNPKLRLRCVASDFDKHFPFDSKTSFLAFLSKRGLTSVLSFSLNLQTFFSFFTLIFDLNYPP